jgi:hypothetical protein
VFETKGIAVVDGIAERVVKTTICFGISFPTLLCGVIGSPPILMICKDVLPKGQNQSAIVLPERVIAWRLCR